MSDKKTILLVEDEILIAMVEKKNLENYGYKVIIINTGEEAIDIVKKDTSINLILMDINLGKGIYGTIAAEIILKEHDIPIIFLSSHTEREIVEKTEGITSYGYVVKNSNITVLDASIKMAYKLFESKLKEKAKEEALKASEEDYRKLFEDHSAIKLMVDPDTGYIYDANFSAADFYGWSREELKTMNIQQITTNSLEETQSNIKKAINNEKSYFEIKHKISDGSIKDVDVYSSKIKMSGKTYLHLIIHDITERKQVEEALQEIELHYKQLFDAIPESVLLIGIDRCVVAANKSSASLYGYESPQQLVGLDTRLLIAEKDRDRASQVQTNILQGEEIPSRIYTEVRRNGTEFVAEVISTTLYGPQQEVAGYIGITRDITERKRTEELLRKSEELYRIIFENTPLAINITRGTNIIYANPSYLEMFGFSNLDELNKVPPLELFTPESRPKIYENIQNRAKGLPVPNNYETECFRKDGTKFPILMYVTRLIFEDGPATVVFVLDITARKNAEIGLIKAKEKAEENLEQFRAIFDNSKDAIGLSKNGVSVMVNQSYLDMFGYSNQDEIIGKPVLNQISPKEHVRIRQYITKRYNNQDVPKQYETIGIRKNGDEFPFEMNVDTYFLNGEKFSVGIMRDITDRKQVEEELRENKKKLIEAQKQAHIGVWNWIINTDTVFWTEELYNIAGLDPKYPAPSYKEHSNLYTHESWEILKTAVDKSIETGKPYQLELELIRSDGDIRYVDAFGGAKYDTRGQVVELFGTVQDITEWKKNEKIILEKNNEIEVQNEELQHINNELLNAKKQAEEINRIKDELLNKFNEAQKIAHVGSWEWNMKTNQVWWSEETYELFGLKSNEFIPGFENNAQYVHPDDLDEYYGIFANCIQTGELLNHDFRIKTPAGEIKQCDVQGKVFFENNRPVKFIGTIYDITERKLADEKIKSLLQEKETLLKEVHHRIKNNIASMESFLLLHVNETVNTEVKSALQDALTRIQSMRVLYDKLLIGNDYQEVSVKDYTESLIDAIVSMFPDREKVTIEKRIADFNLNTKIMVTFGIIINELITNVFKYEFKERDNGHISISLDKTENHFTLAIQDNGKGIDERFDINKSSGFGLMIIRMLTEQLNGIFTIENFDGTRSILKFDI